MSNEELAARIQAGERELMPELWEQVRRFVAKMAARRYILSGGYGGVEIDDLIQAGYLALCEAVERFKPGGEYKFLTYLGTCLKTAFSEAAGIRWERIARDPINTAKSLDMPLKEDDPDGDTLGDLQADPSDAFEEADHRIWLEQLHKALDSAMDDLPPAERETLRRRFWDDMTLKEIGEADGVSYQLVRQREVKALRTLHRRKHRYHLDEFADERRRYVDERTPWYLSVGVESFSTTGSSAVERIALIRERLEREAFGRSSVR